MPSYHLGSLWAGPQCTSALTSSKHELSGEMKFIQWVSCTVSSTMFEYRYHHCLQSSDGCWRDRRVYQAERELFSSWSCKICLLCPRLQPSSRAQVYPSLAASPDGLLAGDRGTEANSSWPPQSEAMRQNVPLPTPPPSPPHPVSAKQNLKNNFWLFPRLAAQTEAAWYANPAVCETRRTSKG